MLGKIIGNASRAFAILYLECDYYCDTHCNLSVFGVDMTGVQASNVV